MARRLRVQVNAGTMLPRLDPKVAKEQKGYPVGFQGN